MPLTAFPWINRLVGCPHGGKHCVPTPTPPQPRQATFTQRQPFGQSAELRQLLAPAQGSMKSDPQKHSPSTVVEQRQSNPSFPQTPLTPSVKQSVQGLEHVEFP